MKGSEIYVSVVERCLDLQIAAAKYSYLFHSAVLCMGANPVATDHDTFRVYFEREAVRLGMDAWSRRPAPNAEAERYNAPGAFLDYPLSFYLPQDAEILNAHIEAYENLAAAVPELWVMYGPEAGGCELTAITTYLMGDIVEAVRQLHAKHN